MTGADIIRAQGAELANPLRAEMHAAVLALDIVQLRWLIGHGIPAATLHAASKIGVVTASTDKRDYWQHDEGGRGLLVTPLEEDGCIIDLIAFDPKVPGIWYLRSGNGWCLGMDAVQRASDAWDKPERLLLHNNPLGWLRADRVGACVAQWTTEARATLRGLAAIEVGSPKHAAALRLELTRPPRIPEISVKGWRQHAA